LEISVPLRIVILAPSILFFVTLAWSWIFRGYLTNRIVSIAAPRNPRKVEGIVLTPFMESLVAEATIVFLVNGLTILLVLGDQIAGAIQMIAGIVFSMTLLLALITSKRELSLRGFAFAFYLLGGFVVGQLIFLFSYGPDIVLPWVGFVFPIGLMGFGAWFVAKRIGYHKRKTNAKAE